MIWRSFLLGALLLAPVTDSIGGEQYSASGLNLSLPKEALAPRPIYIVVQDHPDTLASVRAYTQSILRQIDGQIMDRPLLDAQGNAICSDRVYDYLIVLDHTGRLVDILMQPTGAPDPRNVAEITLDHVRRSAQNATPFPPFPEPERLGPRLVGIPATFIARCRNNFTVRHQPRRFKH